MFIDSHCHLEDELINNTQTLNQINNDKDLFNVITLGTDIVSSKKAIDFAKKYSKVYACVGIHPENAEQWNEQSLNDLEILAKQNKVVAIGEIGLDYHYNKENKSLQTKIFIEQIKLAYKLKLPICIHCRDAVEDVYEILKSNISYLKYGAVMHCFCETESWAKKFCELGLFISFAGNFTYKGYDKNVAKKVPLNKILIETDSPYLSPVPFRGQINTPVNVKFIAQELSKVLEIELNEISKITTDNAKRFYNIK